MSKGPMYGVELIDVLPLGQFGTCGTLQAMPSRLDLRRVVAVSERTVAGYEVLLGHFVSQKTEIELLRRLIRNWVHMSDLVCEHDCGCLACVDLRDAAANEARQRSGEETLPEA